MWAPSLYYYKALLLHGEDMSAVVVLLCWCRAADVVTVIVLPGTSACRTERKQQKA